MKRKEAESWLIQLLWLFTTAKRGNLADLVEEVYNRVSLDTPLGLPLHLLHEYSQFIIPAGRRGRTRLVLMSPYEARVRALLVGILWNLDDESERPAKS